MFSRYSDSLRAGRCGDRIPVGVRFSVPVQTGPGAHPASYTMGTGSFQGVKRPGCGDDQPPPSNAEVEERVELYICSHSGPSWSVPGELYFYVLYLLSAFPSFVKQLCNICVCLVMNSSVHLAASPFVHN